MLYIYAQYVEKLNSIAVLLNLLHYFYHEIQCDKTSNFVHGKALKYSMKLYRC